MVPTDEQDQMMETDFNSQENQVEISEEEMLDIAEQIFNMIAQCLLANNLDVK